MPRSLLGAVRALELEWLVPAWLPDKIVAYLRALPKEQRRPLVPLPSTAADALAAMGAAAGRQSLPSALSEALREIRQVEIAPSAFDERVLPEHLKMRVAVVSADGRVLAASRDLRALQRELGAAAGVSAAVELEATPARWRRAWASRWIRWLWRPSPSTVR